MDYLVDGGKIERVQATSARAAALMALTDFGNQVRWPIVVMDEASGERAVFVEEAGLQS